MVVQLVETNGRYGAGVRPSAGEVYRSVVLAGLEIPVAAMTAEE